MRSERGFIANILLIAVVLSIVFLSQLPNFKALATVFYANAINIASPYYETSKLWFQANIYPRINQEVEKRGEIVKEEIDEQKEIVAQSMWEKIKNYFSAKISKTFGTEVK